jgi:hypothetical protein
LIPRSLRGRFLFRSISFTDKLASNVNVYSAKQAIVGLLEKRNEANKFQPRFVHVIQETRN